MKRHGLVLLLLAAGCSSVEDKAACSTSADCPTGEWCASAEGERRCWPDAVAPVASDVTLACGTTPCLRDGTLRVEATIADDHEAFAAEATLDLDPARPVPLTRSGVRWVADVPLRDFPFERFDGPVTARVVGVDGAKTRSAAVQSAAVQVTRLRWEYAAANALTSPAVMSDGTAVLGVATLGDQLLAVGSDGMKRWSLTVGGQAVTAPPAVGSRGIWVAGQDGLLSVAALDGSAILPGGTVQSDGPVDGAVALMVLADEEWGLAASRSGRMVAVNTAGTTDRTSASLSMFYGPVITLSASACSVTTILRCFPFDGAFGSPVEVEGEVVKLTRGEFVNEGPMERGMTVALGRTAMIRVRDIWVIVTERVGPANDPAFFALHGVDLHRVRLLCVKAKNHFRAAFAGRCVEIIDVDCPGPAAADLATLPFRNVTL
jgi:hypothetical protein